MKNIDIRTFISKEVTKRSTSLFEADMLLNKKTLQQEIFDKTVLVIGGAGTIVFFR